MNSHRGISLLLLIPMGLYAGMQGFGQTRLIELTDLAKIVSVSDPQISREGKTIVIVVSRANLQQDRNERELVQVDIASGAQHGLTYERKTVGSPRWSPSGDRLAFTANDGRGKDAKPQIFILAMSGGEARKISDAPEGIEQFAWRPDGRDIAYVTSDEPANRKEIEKHNDAFEVGDNDYLTTETPQPSHIWLVSADGGKAKRLTSGAWSLPKSAPPSSPASPISWSPDGKSLLFTRQEHPHQGDADLTTLQLLNVETGETRKLTKHEKFESFGVFSPDGSHVAHWFPRDGDPNNENEIFVTQTTGGDGTDATRSIDHDLFRVIWMPDGNSLLVAEYNLSDFNVTARYQFKSSPYVADNLKDYRVQSPITYAQQMKTPTLIMHDTGDARVTISQGYALYHALKDNGVPVKFVAIPIVGHGPGDPVRRMDTYRRWVEWMDQYLK